jgi:hypothetical protein
MNTSLNEGEGEGRPKRTCLQGGGDTSMGCQEGEAHLRRGRLVYREGDSSTEGETCLSRWRLVYGWGGLSTEEVARLQRARLVYGGRDSYLQRGCSSTKGENTTTRVSHLRQRGNFRHLFGICEISHKSYISQEFSHQYMGIF